MADIFDDVVGLDESVYRAGLQDGLQVGRVEGLWSGAHLGYQAGFAVGEELGYMLAFVQLCSHQRRVHHGDDDVVAPDDSSSVTAPATMSLADRVDRSRSLLRSLDQKLAQCAASVSLAVERALRADECAERAAAIDQETAALVRWARQTAPADHQAEFAALADRVDEARVLLNRVCARLRLTRPDKRPDLSF